MKLKNICDQGVEIPDEKGVLFTVRPGETVEWNGDLDTSLVRTRIAVKELEVVEEPKSEVKGGKSGPP